MGQARTGRNLNPSHQISSGHKGQKQVVPEEGVIETEELNEASGSFCEVIGNETLRHVTSDPDSEKAGDSVKSGNGPENARLELGHEMQTAIMHFLTAARALEAIEDP